MKKGMLKILLASLVLTFVSAPVFATDGGDCGATLSACIAIADDTGGGAGFDLKLSPNVEMAYVGSPNAYVIASWNSSGTKGYGASSQDQGLWVTKSDYTASGDIDSLVPTDASTAFDSDDWAVVGK